MIGARTITIISTSHFPFNHCMVFEAFLYTYKLKQKHLAENVEESLYELGPTKMSWMRQKDMN